MQLSKIRPILAVETVFLIFGVITLNHRWYKLAFSACWLGVTKSIRLVKVDWEVAWLSVRSKVRMICTWSSWCHCHPIICCHIKIQNGVTFLVPAYPGCRGKEAIKRMSDTDDISRRWTDWLKMKAVPTAAAVGDKYAGFGVCSFSHVFHSNSKPGLSPKKHIVGICRAGFCRPYALPVAQPTTK